MTTQPIGGMSPCPDWCTGGPAEHLEALEQGVALDEQTHRSGDLTMRLDALHNPHNGQMLRPGGQVIDLELIQDGQPLPFGGLPVIRVELTDQAAEDQQRVVMDLMSGEARSLARMLEHLADQRDLRM